MPEFQQELDARNESCPMPVMKTKKALKGMASGEILHVMATDPASVEDIGTLLENLAANIVENNEEGGVYHFYIKKD